MQDSRNLRIFMIGALALALAALIAVPASAKPTPYLSHGIGVDAAQFSGAEPELVIPYLSHGTGVDQSDFAGAAAKPRTVIPYLSHGMGIEGTQFAGAARQTVVPYLSHGVGVDESQFSGQPNAPKPTAPTAADDDGLTTAWKVGGVAALLAAAAALALVGMQRRDVAVP
jgi:hypothetical protein